MSTVRAKYENGVLTPLEPLDLEEGAEVSVSVTPPDREEQKEGPLLRILLKVQERQAELAPDTWDDLPSDLSKNKKHYPYGHTMGDD